MIVSYAVVAEEVEFFWKGSGTEVLLTGDFLNWNDKVSLSKLGDNNYQVKQVRSIYQFWMYIEGTKLCLHFLPCRKSLWVPTHSNLLLMVYGSILLTILQSTMVQEDSTTWLKWKVMAWATSHKNSIRQKIHIFTLHRTHTIKHLTSIYYLKRGLGVLTRSSCV